MAKQEWLKCEIYHFVNPNDFDKNNNIRFYTTPVPFTIITEHGIKISVVAGDLVGIHSDGNIEIRKQPIAPEPSPELRRCSLCGSKDNLSDGDYLETIVADGNSLKHTGSWSWHYYCQDCIDALGKAKQIKPTESTKAAVDEYKDTGRPCPKCQVGKLLYLLSTSSDGGYEDDHYKCSKCDYSYWIDGYDA